MRRIGWYLALLLVIITNCIVLFGVRQNRQQLPEAAITMTERELPIAYSYNEEDSSISLRLRTSESHEYDEPAWFDQQKLESIGYRFKLPEEDKERQGYIYAIPSRKSFAALEFDGPAWLEHKARREAQIRKLEQELAATMEQKEKEDLQRRIKSSREDLQTASRLIAIDVGNDPHQLRQRYPDNEKVLILPVEVKAIYVSPSDNPETQVIRGAISNILVASIHVPKDKRLSLEQLQPARNRRSISYGAQNRYQVALKIGKRLEPWVEEVRLLD